MKRSRVLIAEVFLFTCLGAGAVAAADDGNPGNSSGDDLAIEQNLANQYGVDAARVDSLRRQGLGYGEVSNVLSIARQMPGGINDQNVNQVLGMRGTDGHKVGWGLIDRELGLKTRADTDEPAEGAQVDTGPAVSGQASVFAKADGNGAVSAAGINGAAEESLGANGTLGPVALKDPPSGLALGKGKGPGDGNDGDNDADDHSNGIGDPPGGTGDPVTVPEPSSLVLFATGLLGAALVRKFA